MAPAGYIESTFNRREKAVLWLANVLLLRAWPFGYQRDSRLYWWLAAKSYTWCEIQNERRRGDA